MHVATYLEKHETLRDIIRRMMIKKRIGQSELAALAKVDKAALSRAMSGKRPFSLGLLDSLNTALNLPNGELYRYYESEMYDPDGKIITNKLCGFIKRCFECRLDEIGRFYISKLFEVNVVHKEASKRFLSLGEHLFHLGYVRDAIEVFRLTISIEQTKKLDTQTLALGYYRLFLALQEIADEQTYDIAILFSYQIDIMPRKSRTTLVYDGHNLIIDAYQRLITFFKLQERWDKVRSLCDKLAEVSKAEKEEWSYGFALVEKVNATYKSNNYEEVLRIIEEYIKVPDESGYFKRVGVAKRFNVLIEGGNLSLIPEYLDWLEKNREEMNYALHVVLKAYLSHFELDKMGDVFAKYLPMVDENYRISSKSPSEQKKLIHIYCLYAHYLVKTSHLKTAAEVIMRVVEMAESLNVNAFLGDVYLLCLDLYPHIDPENKPKIRKLIEKNYRTR